MASAKTTSAAALTGTPQKKNNAASQRSRRKRVSHPLLETEGSSAASLASSTPKKLPAAAIGKVLFEYSTPPRHSDPNVVTPALTTCSPDSPALVDALKMAARPSPPRSNDTRQNTDVAESPQTSYSSSIEAMAAYVEASRQSQRRNVKKVHNTRYKRGNGSDTSTSSSSIVSNINKQSSYTKKPLSTSSTSTGGTKAASPIHYPTRAWIIPIFIIVFFLLSEIFLGMLVFYLKDSVAVAGESVVVTPDLHLAPDLQHPKFTFGNTAEDEILADKVIESEEVDIADELDTFDLGSSDVESHKGPVNEGISNDNDEADNIEQFEEFKKLQSMLDEGFDGLKASIIRKGGELNRKLVESTCGNVWVVANESLNNDRTSNDGHIESIVPISWESLALDAQHCLGGAGLAFLDKNNLDMERLRLSTQVFDRLSTIRPFDPNVRAGLGTCLLIQGIFHQGDNSNSSNTKAKSPIQSSLLSLATYHLKVASSLFSSPQSATIGSGHHAISAQYGVSKPDDENAASHAAILHNLALAYLAVGDTDSSVLFLLRATAIRREHHSRNESKPYWNAPDDVLQAAEVTALLVAAKPNWALPTKQRGKRIPFLPHRTTDIE